MSIAGGSSPQALPSFNLLDHLLCDAFYPLFDSKSNTLASSFAGIIVGERFFLVALPASSDLLACLIYGTFSPLLYCESDAFACTLAGIVV